jgi:hypothetical protein
MVEHPCLSPWKGAVIGGLIAFAWGSISWMALPFHNKTLNLFSDAAPIVGALEAQGGRSGIYVLHNDPKGQTAPTDPFLFVSYEKKGWGSMPATMLLALLVQGAGAFFWTWILGKIPGLTPKDTALYGFFFGLCVGLLGAAPNSVWWKFDWGFTALHLIDACVAWTLASLAIARWGKAAVCELPRR